MPDRFAEDMPASSPIGALLTAVMRQGLAVKGVVDRGAQLLLGLVGLPSRADLLRLQSRLDVLQGTVTNLSIKVDRLLDAEIRSRDVDVTRTTRSPS